jgi:NitT/TauT family transport system ATP-binding protein
MFVTHDLEDAIALSDRVVLMSSGPSSRLIGDFRIDLPRPRNIADIRVEPRFHALHREIWNTLKVEVQKAYDLGEGKDA